MSDKAYFTYAFGDLSKDPLDQSIEMWASEKDAKDYAYVWRATGYTVVIWKGEIIE